jgi:hypothetical protein
MVLSKNCEFIVSVVYPNAARGVDLAHGKQASTNLLLRITRIGLLNEHANSDLLAGRIVPRRRASNVEHDDREP